MAEQWGSRFQSYSYKNYFHGVLEHLLLGSFHILISGPFNTLKLLRTPESLFIWDVAIDIYCIRN